MMVKSSCIQPGNGKPIEVHAGGRNESNAEQVVGATIFSAAEASPEGVEFLRMNTTLSFSRNVSLQALILSFF